MAKIFGNPLDLYTFDSMGQLTTVEDETGVTKLQNNERGLLTRVENPAGDVVQYGYNEYGQKTVMTYPDGTQARYAYDEMSRLVSATEPDGTTTRYEYDRLGRRTQTTDGTLTTAYRYDKNGNLTEQKNNEINEITEVYQDGVIIQTNTFKNRYTFRIGVGEKGDLAVFDSESKSVIEKDSKSKIILYEAVYEFEN